MLFRRYLLRSGPPNPHHTTDVTLGLNPPSRDGRNVTEQALARASYIRESCTTSCHWRWTGLVEKGRNSLRLLWQRSPDLLSMDPLHIPSKTSWKLTLCDRTRYRTGEPTLWQLSCHSMGRRMCRTGYFWLQNTRERSWLWASELR